MKHKGIWMGLGAVFLLALVIGGVGGYRYLVGGADDGPQGGPVALPSTRGDFALTQLEEDQLAVLFFGYTYCPDVCPMSLSVVRQAMGQLVEGQRRRVVPVLISVDPERDSLERLDEYTGFFGEAFIGATGTQAQLEDIAERYGVIWRRVEAPDSAMEYTIDHSSSLYLVDRHGQIQRRVLYSPTHHALAAALEKELSG
jgi:protein SCO1/2